MEIIKHGHSDYHSALFNCKRCGCIYVASRKECIRDKNQTGVESLVSFCPDCGFLNHTEEGAILET